MGLVSPSQSNPGETIDASDINNPVNQIAAVVNGNIDTNNIAAAGVGTTQLADNSVTYAKVAPGAVVQVAYNVTTAVATGTTLIPIDDTIPQNTEGDQYMTQAITPKSATNILVIDATLLLANSAATNTMIASLFQDATANALAATGVYMAVSGSLATLRIIHLMVAGTTSATTFKVRAGGISAGTTTFNGAAGGRLFGAITKSSMMITEYKA